jgi:substrate import-associated zinc metallohydrolase lipoprotein
MNKFNIIITVIFAGLVFVSCGKEDLGQSNITIPEVSSDPTDIWVMENYTNPYNIKVNYKWVADMSDPSRYMVPAKQDFVIPFLKTVKKVWLEPYGKASALGTKFMKQYSARDLMLVGSGSYNNDNSVTLGWAAGGYKVTLFTVNEFDFEKGVSYDDLKRFFHTFHHEFGHILNQRKLYSSEFKKITGGYNPDWTSSNDEKARENGFITAYGSSADTEEFVEVYSIYVTSTVAEWNKIINDIRNQQAKVNLNRKVEAVRFYFQDSYGLDIDEMRSAITTAIQEVVAGNLD